MPRSQTARQYGKPSKRSKADRLFAELPQTPVRKPNGSTLNDDVTCIIEQLSSIKIADKTEKSPQRKSEAYVSPTKNVQQVTVAKDSEELHHGIQSLDIADNKPHSKEEKAHEVIDEPSLRILTWDDVCPPKDQIVKIAEASFAEVYRITNERGTSIIKVIRLDSPIKPQTKQQIQARIIDELPHSEHDLEGELQISQWLAGIPGFVVYKERYIVQGKATRGLLETHQLFQKRAKRRDPGRAQFYPSPSRYLDGTKFLVVELGDAGTALEDWKLSSENELWDVFFLEAIALARAEDLAMFEHRDLHEGNLCIKQVGPPRERDPDSEGFFGYSGLDITILDYGLSRAEDLSVDFAKPIAYDLEQDLSMFTSTHASQCQVYRQMRSFLLGADRQCLPPEEHTTPYDKGIDGPLSWEVYAPYTNVLWLAYLYQYMVDHFTGDDKELARFKKQTRELWKHLNPEAKPNIPCFGSAADVVCFAVESGWVREEQLMDAEASVLEREESIILSADDYTEESSLRRSPRRRKTIAV